MIFVTDFISDFHIPIHIMKRLKTQNAILDGQVTYFSFDVDSAGEIQTRKSALVVNSRSPGPSAISFRPDVSSCLKST